MIRKDQHKLRQEWQSVIRNDQQSAMNDDILTRRVYPVYPGAPHTLPNLLGKTAGQHCLEVNFA